VPGHSYEFLTCRPGDDDEDQPPFRWRLFIARDVLRGGYQPRYEQFIALTDDRDVELTPRSWVPMKFAQEIVADGKTERYDVEARASDPREALDERYRNSAGTMTFDRWTIAFKRSAPWAPTRSQ